ncbi:metallo-beta-lactamase superfamily protein [Trichomonas vaginalis G3]|uniref:ribonuclease Z n=2 Tax=Trichomonas vaginalis (strain ATCC PRA-98 / G3) TaxID=412133 RepID=A2EZ45_TRIV3|nr:metallo-beta-lactamase superfamily protein [Trichomonas vaginalis G3]|eukprot:XP_001330849.1 metallo-beta-lactamase superfamily protein [Trichomonas vaginalis G3]
MTDSLPGDNFLVIDARSLNDLKLIKDLTKYNYVIHFTNNDLLTNPEYVDFFSKVKTNFAFNTNNSVSYQQIYNIYQECAKLHPDFLAPLTSSSKSEEIPSIYTVISQSDVYRLAPLDKKKLEFAPKTQENEVEGEYPKFETFGVTFLGTGARQPSSMRNVTGLMLHTKSGVIAIDPGEDYYGQLCRKYGKTVTEQLLKEIKMVFVTHIHGDHTFGVHKLLSERSKLTNEEIIVQADQILIDELKYYEKYQKFYVNYVNRDTTTVTVGNNVVTSIPVNHCPGSHAILVEIDGKYRFSFTGDKNQEDEYVKTVGKCDLLVHEATYDEDKADKAKEVCHSTVKQAIAVGKELGAKTCLTHISGRYSCGISESEKGSFFVFDYLFIPYERVDEVEAVCKDMIDLMNKSEDN